MTEFPPTDSSLTEAVPPADTADADADTQAQANDPANADGQVNAQAQASSDHDADGDGEVNDADDHGHDDEDHEASGEDPVTVHGLLERPRRGEARLRKLDHTYIGSPDDPVIPNFLVDRYNLRSGDELTVELGDSFLVGQLPKGQRKKANVPPPLKRSRLTAISVDAPRVTRIVTAEGVPMPEYKKKRRRRGKKPDKPALPAGIAPEPEDEELGEDGQPKMLTKGGEPVLDVLDRRNFEDQTSVDPQPRLTLEYPGCPPVCRLIDLFCPIGYGQRAMIVSPPKAGKTTILQNIANAIAINHPKAELYTLLIDERPEEVTDFRRNVPGTVWASSNDHPPEAHVAMAMLAHERVKRRVEYGKDVIVLLDSITRMGRAFNTAPGLQGTGRTLSGGIDAGSLAIPKQIFGAARKFQEGGSLTIIATALIETGSQGDQVIFEEFKGTGNMELILDRKVADQRLFPALNLAASGTRKEQLLMADAEYNTINALRRRLIQMPPAMQIEQLLKALDKYPTNADLVGLNKTPAVAKA